MNRRTKQDIKNLIFDETRVEFAALGHQIVDLEAQIHCGATYGHCFTLIKYDGRGYNFQCTNCTLGYYRLQDNLNQIEKNLVVAVFSKQKAILEGKKK